ARAVTLADLTATLVARRWPLAGASAGVAARGRLDGHAEARRERGSWSLTGAVHLLGLDVSGPALAGDRLRLDPLGGTWDVSDAAGAWTIRRLDLACPLARLTGGGSLTAAGGSAKVEAK